jgi:uncharacterized protein
MRIRLTPNVRTLGEPSLASRARYLHVCRALPVQPSRTPDRPMHLPERELIRRIAERHGARNVRVFGSVARGEARPDSDLDLLVEPGPVTSPWFPGGLVADLEEALGRRVDVVTVQGLAPEFRHVIEEAVPV